MWPILVLVTSWISILIYPLSAKCEERCEITRRAAFDIGSGSLKVAVGEFQACEGKPITVKPIPIPKNLSNFPLNLEASKNEAGQIPEDQIQAVTKKINELKSQLSREYGVTEFSAAATHAIRMASNRAEIEQTFQRDVAQVNFRVLTQNQEGANGFFGAARRPEFETPTCSRDKNIVWDIGGGSIQFTREIDGGVSPVNLPTGAEEFLKKVRVLQNKKKPKPKTLCSRTTSESPNPIGRENLTQVEKLASQTLDGAALATLKKWSQASQGQCFVGIGGVHAKALTENLDKKWEHIKPCVAEKRKQPEINRVNRTRGGYDILELRCLAEFLADRDDCDEFLGGPFSKTDVTNILFVIGMMERLKIKSLRTFDINMTDTLLMVEGQNSNSKTLKNGTRTTPQLNAPKGAAQ